MRILFGSPYGGAIGGIVRWAQNIIKYYEISGHKDCKMDVLPMGRQSFTNINSTFKRVYYGIKDYYAFLKKEKEMMNSRKYDIFHLSSSGSLSLFKDFIMLRAAQKKGVKTIIHFHFGRIPDLFAKKNWEWKMICKVVALSDTTIVIDRVSYNTLYDAGFKNVVFLPNPVALRATELIEKIGKKEPKERTLLFAGHGVPTKGIYELIEACKQIPDIKLKMIGNISDDTKARLEKMVDNATWLDVAGEYPYEKTIAEMLSCDVFILPTYTEGFPNVILESMACGCAIVTTPVGAIPEMLEEENGKQYGILVAPKNVDELKEGIEKMLTDKHLKEECRKNVQQRVNKRYNIDAVWRQMVTIWNKTLK